MIEFDDIDRADGRFGIGVGGQQDTPHIGELTNRSGQEFDARHPWHAVIREEERYRFGALREPPEDVERAWARVGGHHPIAVAVLLSKIAFDRPQHVGVVVDCQQYWSRHQRASRRRSPHGYGEPGNGSSRSRSPALRFPLRGITIECAAILCSIPRRFNAKYCSPSMW